MIGVAVSGRLVLTIGERWEAGLKKVGGGIGGKWTLKMGGRWEVGPQKLVGLRLKPLPHTPPAGLPTRS